MQTGQLHYDITASNSGFIQKFKEAQNAVRAASGDIEKQGQQFDAIGDKVGKLGKQIAGAFAAAKLVEYTKQVATVRGQFQQLEQAFKTMLGSEEKANTLMQQLIHTAAITPFGVTEVTQGAKQLLAYGVAAENINDTLMRLGDIAAGLTIPLNDLTYLYGTTMAQGRLYTQDLNQFTGRGIPMIQELAKQFGVAESQVKSLVEEGKVGFPEVQKVIESLTGEGSKFGGLMEAQSKTISGQISNIEDAIEQMFNSIGKSSEGVISDSLGIVSELVDNWQTIGKAIGVVIAAYGAFKAATVAVNAVMLINKRITEEAALQKAYAAQRGIILSQAEAVAEARTMMLNRSMAALNATMRANVFGIIAAVVATAVSAFVAFGDETETAAEHAERFGKAADKTTTELQTLYAVANQATSDSKTQKDALDDLQKTAEEYGMTIDKEKDRLTQLNDIRDIVIAKIKEEAIERAKANEVTDTTTAYGTAKDDAWKDFADNIDIPNAQTYVNQFRNLITEDDIAKMQKLNAEWKKWRDAGAKPAEAGAFKAAKKEVDAIEQRFLQFLETADVSQVELGKVGNAFVFLGQDLGGAKTAFEAATEATNQAARAAQKAALQAAGLTDNVGFAKDMATKCTGQVKQLGQAITNLMNNNADNYISFTIGFNMEVPDWMMSLDLKELQRRAQGYADVAVKARNSVGRKYYWASDNRWYTEEEAMQASGVYAAAAQAKANPKKSDKKGTASTESDADKKAREKEAERRRKEEEQRRKEAEQRAENVRNLTTQEAERQIEAERKAAQDIADATEQLRIDAIKDEGERELATMRQNLDKKLREIDNETAQEVEKRKEAEKKIWLAAEKDRKESDFKSSKTDAEWVAEVSASTQAPKQREQAYQQYYAERAKAEAETQRKLAESRNEYYKNYGTPSEKRAAINEDYARQKQDAGGDTFKVKQLEEQRKEAISQLNMQDLKDTIDWDSVFGNLGEVSDQRLQQTTNALERFKQSTEFKNMDPEGIKAITEALEKLREEADSRTSGIAGLKAAYVEMQGAETELATAKIARAEAERNANDAMARLASITPSLTGKTEEQTKAEEDAAAAQNTLKEANQAVTDAEAKQVKSKKKVGRAIEQVGEDFSQLGSSIQNVGSELGGTAGKIISSTGSMVSSIGSAISTVGSIATKQMNAMEKASAILTIISNAVQLLNVVNNLLGDGGQAEYEKAKEALSAYSDALQEVIDRQKELTESVHGFGAVVASEYTSKLLRQNITEYQKTARQYLNVKTGGFLGIGRKSNLSREASDSGLSKNTISSLTSMTGDQLAAFRESHLAAWSKLSDEFREYLESIIDLYDQIENETDSLQEKITGISFDSFRDSFIDTLKDMDASAGDFADSMTEYINNAIIDNMLADQVEAKLKKIYQQFYASASDGKLTASEIQQLNDQREQLVDWALDQRQTLIDSGLIDTSASEDAASRSVASMSEETGEELNGRFTALQLNSERQIVLTEQMNSSISGLLEIGTSGGTYLNELRNAAILSNTYLADIQRDTAKIYKEWTTKLDTLVEQTKYM